MNPWDLLGISETKDRKAIKRAYAKSMKQCHPEDDPEGFQAIREAYEIALSWVDVEEKASLPGEDTLFLELESDPVRLEKARLFQFNPSSQDEKAALDLAQDISHRFLNLVQAEDTKGALAYLRNEAQGTRLWERPLCLDLMNLNLLQFFDQQDFWPAAIITELRDFLFWNLRLEQLVPFIGKAGLSYYQLQIRTAIGRPHRERLHIHWQTFESNLKLMPLVVASNILNNQLKKQLKETPETELFLFPFLLEQIKDENLDPEVFFEIWFGYDLEKYILEHQMEDQNDLLFEESLAAASLVFQQIPLQEIPQEPTSLSQSIFNFFMLFLIGVVCLFFFVGLDWILKPEIRPDFFNSQQLTAEEQKSLTQPGLTTTEKAKVLAMVLQKGSANQLETFLAHNQININFTIGPNRQYPLAYCLKNHQFEKAKALVKRGPDLDFVMPKARQSYLFQTIAQNNQKGLSFLLEHGANPNQGNWLGYAPLYLAINQDNQAMALELLKHGADPDWTSSQIPTSPRQLAQENNQWLILKYMENRTFPIPNP